MAKRQQATFQFERPESKVTVTARHLMYAQCSVYGCSNKDGYVIDLGTLEVRLCYPHAKDVKVAVR